MTMQQYCLRWNNHQPNFISVFSSLLNSESLVDVTLAAEGRHVQAHKVVLSACSSYFQSLFTINPCQHPIVILKDVKFADLKVMVDFMYYGEVNVSQEQLPYILKTAEMLKIKGLAEIPVDQSVSRSAQNNSSDKAELLTPGDSNWSTGDPRQSLSPLSPNSKRKRLRKSSTGSTERGTSDEQQSGEVTLTASSVLGTVIKSDPGSYGTENSGSILQKSKGHSSDSDLHRGSSHESVEGEITHQVTLQVPQEVNIHHSLEQGNSAEMSGPSSSGQPQLTVTEKTTQSHTQVQIAQRSQLQQQQAPQQMGTKRGRFLMRQPRIKRESDLPSSQSLGDNDPLSPSQQHFHSHHQQYLSVPPVRVERQCSEPLPVHSPPPGANLLTVPGQAVLVKQLSHPLLPSQIQSKTIPTTVPLQIQVIPQASAMGGRSMDESERPLSPVVVIADPLSPSEIHLRADSVPAPNALRLRADELKRSASSPQSGTRSSHCPVVRPGPALGCNYCWNTVDTHGRILRRKTKYHCPECQTNLCIVPCFQEYHERHVSGGGAAATPASGGSGSQTDPIALTTSVMRVFPKTSSM